MIMKYRNKITGIVIEVPCVISGAMWEPVEEQAPAIVEKKRTKK